MYENLEGARGTSWTEVPGVDTWQTADGRWQMTGTWQLGTQGGSKARGQEGRSRRPWKSKAHMGSVRYTSVFSSCLQLPPVRLGDMSEAANDWLTAPASFVEGPSCDTLGTTKRTRRQFWCHHVVTMSYNHSSPWQSR